MRKLFTLLSAILVVNHCCSGFEVPASLKDFLAEQDSDIEESEVMEKLVIGSLNHFLLLPQLEEVLDAVVADYSDDLVYRYKIGETSEGRSIMAYVFMKGTDHFSFVSDLTKRPSIVLQAAHHARELVTVSQVVYQMVSLLHGLEHGNQEYEALVQNAAIIFIPTINVDGVAFISDYW